LDSWLFPPGAEDADIYSIAFQEIVQLNAQQILQTDPAKRYVDLSIIHGCIRR